MTVTEQVLDEVFGSQPEPVIPHLPIAMAQAGKDEEVEAFVRLDERLGHPERANRVHVVVDVARREQQVPLQVLRQIRVLFYIILEGDFA